ncbi:hypothetical protein EV701_120117 [Chthoniobacter flavus]|nr:hypothetical protein EV701_120117 [Chthoniobacter flavus]
MPASLRDFQKRRSSAEAAEGNSGRSVDGRAALQNASVHGPPIRILSCPNSIWAAGGKGSGSFGDTGVSKLELGHEGLEFGHAGGNESKHGGVAMEAGISGRVWTLDEIIALLDGCRLRDCEKSARE